MKYLISQALIFILSVTFLYQLTSYYYFIPMQGDIVNWYNVTIVLLLVFTGFESFIAFITYFIQKVFIYGIKESPSPILSMQLGISAGFGVILILFLSVLGISSLVLIFAIIIIIVILNIILFLR